MTIKANQLPRKSPGDVEAGACNFVNELRASELLSGTPTVVEQTTSDLTITNQGLNAGSVTIAGSVAAASQAVLWTVSGGTAGQLYSLKITVSTDASDSRTLNRLTDFFVE